MLWENYVVAERMKTMAYAGPHGNRFYWRTRDGQEIDYVEERDGTLHGYEIKYTQRAVKEPARWRGMYPSASFEVIHRGNIDGFLTGAAT
jgi:predicted AAA+ superfamily ATPase